MRVALVAGEASGDRLGAGLVRALRARVPDARFLGVGGPLMAAEGVELLARAEALSVMGLAEVLVHLPRLWRLRARLRRALLAARPDVLVGIDSPDFNLGLERALRRAGVPTVHYVSPSVWAWREGRVRTVARAAERVLTLFDFEEDFYRRHGVAATFVGHPLADLLPEAPDRAAARAALGLPARGPVVAVLPGSRRGEVTRLGPPFAAAVARLAARRPALRFVAPMAGAAAEAAWREALARHAPSAPVLTVRGRAHEALAAADVALVASGTATLEALLLKCPMVVAYRLSPLTYAVARRLVRIGRYALPNLLAGADLVPELIQDAVTPERLSAEVLGWLEAPERRRRLEAAFGAIHRRLRRDADRRAAEAVLEVARRTRA